MPMIHIPISPRLYVLVSPLLLCFSIASCQQSDAAEKLTVLEKTAVTLPPVSSPIKTPTSESYANRLGIKSIFIGDSFENVTAMRSIKTRCSVNLGDAKAANGDSPEMSKIREKLRLTTTERYQSCLVDGVATVGGLNVRSFQIEFFDSKALRIIVTFEQKYPDKLKYDEREKLYNKNLIAFLDALTLHFQTPFTQGSFCKGGSCRGIGGGTSFTRYTWQRRDGHTILDKYSSFNYLTISSSEGDSLSATRTADIDKVSTELRIRKEYEQKQEQQQKKSNTARDVARDL